MQGSNDTYAQVLRPLGHVYDDSSEMRNLLTLVVGQQTYALPIEPIVQIVEMVTLTPLPRANRLIEGLINVRGTVAPVLNLGRLLGKQPTKKGLHTPIVLVMVDERMVGLIVDEVEEVVSVADRQILDPKAVLPEGLGKLPFLAGLVRTSRAPVMLLDLSALFQSHPEGLVEALEQALSPWAGTVEGMGVAEEPGEVDTGDSEALSPAEPDAPASEDTAEEMLG